MPKTLLVVEVHVPLQSPQPAWVEAAENFLLDLEEQGETEVYDDAEQFGDADVFFLTGPREADVLRVASRLASLPGMPRGAFAVVTTDRAPLLAQGRRVPLPLAR